ncbi:MAG: response regulator [Verrucomicrobiota bacterium]
MPEPCIPSSLAICIVDDDSALLQLLEMLLEAEGFQSQTFENSQHFVEHARQHPVLLAILDIHMPGLTGLDVQILLKEFSPRTRVIIITGQDAPALRQRAEANGAIGFLLKPFDINNFISLVRTTVETPV